MFRHFFIKTLVKTHKRIRYIYKNHFMRFIFLICAFLISSSVLSQNEQVALNYFNEGEFEKALISYQKLYEANKANTNYLLKIIEAHQQLEHFEIAEDLLLQLIDKTKNPQYLVELGYNFQLKNELEKANDYYNQAVFKN